jgi:poly(3-hydroxyalkanoate) synthetase
MYFFWPGRAILRVWSIRLRQKYQYWTNEAKTDTLAEFVAQATETPGSWWNHWLGWLKEQAPGEVAARASAYRAEEVTRFWPMRRAIT